MLTAFFIFMVIWFFSEDIVVAGIATWLFWIAFH